MPAAPYANNESERLKVLESYDIMDSMPEQEYDDVLELASQICEAPIALISLLDYHRQWFKSRRGVDDAQTPRSIAMCSYAILQDEPLEVENALEDPRFADNPFVLGDTNVRFYTGVPLVSTEGYKLGTLCVLDNKPRKLSDKQLFALKTLATQVMQLMELRRELREKERMATQLTGLLRMRDTMLSVMAHDMRDPLVSLKSMFALLNDGSISHEEASTFSSQMEMTLENATNLLDNLLHWSRRYLKETTRLQTIALRPVAMEVISMYEHRAATKLTNIICNISPSVYVLADPDIISMAFRNFIYNAVKFTQQGKIIVDAIPRTDEHVLVSVQDTGQGMTEAQRSALFSWEHKRSTRGTGNEHGSGYGLLLTKELLQSIGTDIEVESQPEQGTRISFSLSLAP
jgi:signal transduction histidine kinase